MARSVARQILLVAAGFGLLCASGWRADVDAETLAAPQRQLAPDFALVDSQGTRVTLSAYKGRVVMLDFWATWCAGCKVEIPWFIEFAKKYERQGFTAIGAAMDEEGWTLVRPYLAEHPINYPIVPGYPTLMAPYQITALPVTLLIDRQGRVAEKHVGIVDKDAWDRSIRELLDETAPRE